MKFDELITNHIGEWGRYQKVQMFLVCLPTVFAAMHALSWTFTAAPTPHRCRLPEEVGIEAQFWLPVDDQRILPSKHCITVDGVSCPYEQCEMVNGTKCNNGFVYDTSEIVYSAIQRWDIVCDRSILKAVIQSTYYVGQLIGSVVCGALGDHIGRKKVLFLCIVFQILPVFGMVFAPHLILLGIFRAAAGFTHPGIFVIGVVISMELVGPSKRKMASAVSGLFFAVGQVLLGLIAFEVRDYRLLQLIIAVPSLIFLSYWWLVPESPRWLCSHRRYSEADKVVRLAAKRNKTQIPEKWWESLEDNVSDSKAKRYGYLDLLRTPRMRQTSLAIIFCWPVVAMVYYGVSMNTNFLGGSLYTTFIFGAIMEIPAVLAVLVLIDRLGRKIVLAGGFTIASLCMLSNLVTGEKAHWSISLTQFLLAKGTITGCYASIYTFTPELFPTVIRNTAMGICSMMARLGAIFASYIAMWLVDEFGSVAMIIPFASSGLLAALVIMLFLPETAGAKLPETIEEIEGYGNEGDVRELEPLNTVVADEKIPL